MTALKPEACPCGGGVTCAEAAGPDLWRFECGGTAGLCDMRGPYRGTHAEAARAWNRLALAGEVECLLRRALNDEDYSTSGWATPAAALLARLAPAAGEGENNG